MAKKSPHFCILYWVSNGGEVDSKGNPVFRRSNASGTCPRDPEDAEESGCKTCPLMQHELSFHNPRFVMWVCPACIAEVTKIAREMNSPVRLPGYYSSGICEYSGCTRAPLVINNEEITPAKYSSVLQLFIGDIGQ